MFPRSVSRPRNRLSRLVLSLGVFVILLPVLGAPLVFLPATAAAQPALPCGQVLGIGDPSQSCLRVINADPSGGAIDVYLGDTVVAQKVDFGKAIDFAAVPS